MSSNGGLSGFAVRMVCESDPLLVSDYLNYPLYFNRLRDFWGVRDFNAILAKTGAFSHPCPSWIQSLAGRAAMVKIHA